MQQITLYQKTPGSDNTKSFCFGKAQEVADVQDVALVWNNNFDIDRVTKIDASSSIGGGTAEQSLARREMKKARNLSIGYISKSRRDQNYMEI